MKTRYYIKEGGHHGRYFYKMTGKEWYLLTSFSKGEQRNYWQLVPQIRPRPDIYNIYTEWREVNKLTMLLLMGQEP